MIARTATKMAMAKAMPVSHHAFPVAATMTPGRVYPLYGFHYSLHRSITRLTNIKFFNELFGNSSYVVPYLHRLGYDVSREEQTGSNFGTEFKHETPYLVSIGRGTMIADGLSLLNAEAISAVAPMRPMASTAM